MFLLKWPAFPSPFWFASRNRGEPVDGEVISESAVKTDIEALQLLEGELPPVGAKVIIMPGQYNLTGKTEDEVQKEKEELIKNRDEARKKREEDRKANEKRVRLKAESVNANICVPVEWTSGFKAVLSGLTQNGWGNGINRRSVMHVLLKEDIQEGAFKRSAGSFLCTTKGGNDGMMYADLEHLSCDDEGQYVSEITCKTCLKIAERWSKHKA